MTDMDKLSNDEKFALAHWWLRKAGDTAFDVSGVSISIYERQKALREALARASEFVEAIVG